MHPLPFTVTAPAGPVASGSTIPSVTIRGDTVGTGTLAAEYGGYTPQSYGTWRVHVYENVSDIGTAADIIVAPSFPDLTMRPARPCPCRSMPFPCTPRVRWTTTRWNGASSRSEAAALRIRCVMIT